MTSIRGFLRLAFLCCVAVSPPAAANTLLASPEFRAMRDSQFAPDEVFAFADLAAASGAPDLAISALEQMLIRRPDVVEAHLRLVPLYRDAGNLDQAAAHARAAGLDAGNTGGVEVWGSVTLGAAYDTNPSAAPVSSAIRVIAPGDILVLVPSTGEDGDTLGTFDLALNLSVPLAEQALLAAEMQVSAEKFAAQEELDTLTAYGTIGPWIDAGTVGGLPFFLHPHVSGGAALLAGAPYYWSAAAGLTARLALDDATALSASLTASRTDYFGDPVGLPNPDVFDTTATTLGLGVDGVLSGGTEYSVWAYGAIADARVASESYLYGSLNASMVTPLGRVAGLPVSLLTAADAAVYDYDAPVVLIDPNRDRFDVWIGGEAALIVDLTKAFSFSIGAEYLRRFSNLDPFDTQNLRVYGELGYSF